jgi:hypothetical protein
MSGTSAAQPLIAEETATLRRPGRALIGWMADDLGAIVLAGGRQDGNNDASLVDRVRAARAAVAARPGGIDQDEIIDDTHSSLATITHRLHQQSNTAAFWNEKAGRLPSSIRRASARCSSQWPRSRQQLAWPMSILRTSPRSPR